MQCILPTTYFWLAKFEYDYFLSLKPVKYFNLSYSNFATQKYVVDGYQYIACISLTALCISSILLKPKTWLTRTCHAKRWPTPPSTIQRVMMGRMKNLLPHTQHFLWTHPLPCCDQPVCLFDVLSFLYTLSLNISISDGLSWASDSWPAQAWPIWARLSPAQRQACSEPESGLRISKAQTQGLAQAWIFVFFPAKFGYVRFGHVTLFGWPPCWLASPCVCVLWSRAMKLSCCYGHPYPVSRHSCLQELPSASAVTISKGTLFRLCSVSNAWFEWDEMVLLDKEVDAEG
jgi:hypothetical protein